MLRCETVVVNVYSIHVVGWWRRRGRLDPTPPTFVASPTHLAGQLQPIKSSKPATGWGHGAIRLSSACYFEKPFGRTAMSLEPRHLQTDELVHSGRGNWGPSNAAVFDQTL
ncbi:hypothetical protein X797_010523 [Metarhizium robertsii]|uniref:Uncharacterized protein n=2 Tax=Metarhizium robertsii TaxID=568076 RepID=E9FBB4_METRA|nr:uncharacterized protein MAA_09563 [Metarhizium robertsii ARSEF 23]EFY94985.1 hypothetical protein MAA_09563 [Metarhizium robertsii ARSEF 23]EXU96405.1 hypothetical protein X797_010523 [Metarhizium robertsii]